MSGTDEGVEVILDLWSDRLPYIPMVACGGSLLVSLSLCAVEPKSSRKVRERIFWLCGSGLKGQRWISLCAFGRARQGKGENGALGNVFVRERMESGRQRREKARKCLR